MKKNAEDKTTRDNLIREAKKEFMLRGYMKASLRNICKNAGVTTGALYFFFDNKEALFSAIVDTPVKILQAEIERHFEKEKKGSCDRNPAGEMLDQEAAERIIHFLFTYYDEFILILEKSQGTEYEHIVDRLVAMVDQQNRRIAGDYSRAMGIEAASDFMIHWISHNQIQSFMHIFTHAGSEEEALKHMKEMTAYLRGGWFSVINGKRGKK